MEFNTNSWSSWGYLNFKEPPSGAGPKSSTIVDLRHKVMASSIIKLYFRNTVIGV